MAVPSTLRLQITAAKWPKSYRRLATGAGAASIVPGFVAAWALLQLGIRGIEIAMVSGVFAIAFLGSAIAFFLQKREVTLAPEGLQSRTRSKREYLAAESVVGFLTMRKKDRVMHIALGKDKIIAIGPGLSDEEFAAARTWILDFTARRSVPYHGVMDYREAFQFLRTVFPRRR